METSYEKFVDWFYAESKKSEVSEPSLFDSYLTYLLSIGLSFERVNFGRRALHPQVSSISSIWVPDHNESILEFQVANVALSQRKIKVSTGFVQETMFPIGSLSLSGFVKSPIQHVFDSKMPYRYHFKTEVKAEPGFEFPYPILDDLYKGGMTDYLACPQFFGGNPFGFLSFATKAPGGFTDEALDFIVRSSHIFALRWNQMAQSLTTESLLKIYLGKDTGPQVFSGKILRGDFEEISSVIWFSDIRNFTGISEKSSSDDLVEMLNTYFDICIPVIESLGGEVLKMLGDGLLAVFPFQSENRIKTHFKSLLAARRILKSLGAVNQTRKQAGKPLIEHGVGLHFGKVLYGNIGSKERLDFTVIGEAVNLSSRIAGLCGQLGKAVLASEEFAQETNIHWQDLGQFSLKGVSASRKIYAIPQAEEMAESLR